jgi:hypothetical protein
VVQQEDVFQYRWCGQLEAHLLVLSLHVLVINESMFEST